MKSIRILMAGVALVAAAATMNAEECESQTWLTVEGRYNITKKLRAEVEAEHRSATDLYKGTSRWSVGAGLSYKCTSWLKADAAYKFLNDHEEEEITKKGNRIPAYWQPGHRGQVSLTGSMKLGHFEVSLREAYQYTHRAGQVVPKYDAVTGKQKKDEIIEEENTHYLRSRLEVEYSISKKCPVTPFAHVEMYSDLTGGMKTKKIRYTAGAEYDLNKHNSFNLYYRFIDRNGKSNFNIVGAGYSFKF